MVRIWVKDIVTVIGLVSRLWLGSVRCYGLDEFGVRIGLRVRLRLGL